MIIYTEEEFDGDYLPDNFDAFITWFEEIAKKYQGEERKNLEVSIRAIERGELEITFTTKRKETVAEKNKRQLKQEERMENKKENTRQRELRTLARLTKKYKGNKNGKGI